MTSPRRPCDGVASAQQAPHIKIVGFSASSADLGNQVSPETGFDAVLTKEDGLSELVATLKALMPEPPRE